MEITKAVHDGELVISLEGRLDTMTSPELEQSIRTELDTLQGLAIDLTNLEYVSSSGLRVFLFTFKETTKRGVSFKLIHPNDYVMEVFETTGFTDLLDIEA